MPAGSVLSMVMLAYERLVKLLRWKQEFKLQCCRFCNFKLWLYIILMRFQRVGFLRTGLFI